jgi:maltooligosyltrehalose synthase
VVWNETALALPGSAPAMFEHAITGEAVEARGGTLALAGAMETLPLALLVSG